MTTKLKITIILICAAIVVSVAGDETTSRPSFWRGTVLDSHIEKIKAACDKEDTIACFQYKAFKFLDSVFRKDYFQVSLNY